MYIHRDLRVASVTTGMPLKQVSAAVTKEAIVDRATVFHESLRRDFSVQIPRIAVLSLNPHAGNADTYGAEEKNLILPAIAALEEKDIQAFGPYAADEFFGNGYFWQFDGILAMYEDQALGAFKLIANEDAIQYTAGLPIIRTSTSLTPSYDHAGKGDTDEQTFRDAIYAAIDIYRNRIVYDEPTGNPLPKLYHERRDESEKVRFAMPRTRKDTDTTTRTAETTKSAGTAKTTETVAPATEETVDAE
jgi:4-hydroxythreonine-4-phosphate dehydrogenase